MTRRKAFAIALALVVLWFALTRFFPPRCSTGLCPPMPGPGAAAPGSDDGTPDSR
ncbi:MAG: hypothetical protein ABFC96_09545 [Thermoguttaceae bacterium]